MPNSLAGILAAFAEPALHAWANILDTYFSERLFKRLTTLVFFSSSFGLLLLPVIWRLDPPMRIPTGTACLLALAAFIEVAYLYPYFSALRQADTSVVASLFSLGKLFVPAFAFLFLGERLAFGQYMGFFLITTASIFLALDFRKMRFNRAFPLMFAASLLLAIESILLKHVYGTGVSWGTSIVWMTAFQFCIALFLVFLPGNFQDLRRSLPTFASCGALLIGMEALNWGGTLAGNYGLSRIPVSVAKGIAGTQPIFVLIYALAFAQLWPKVFREYLGKDGVVKKMVQD